MGFSEKHIAVIGGGLGGMSFMNAALYTGLEHVQLYEQAPQFAEVGAGVNITSNANRVLDAFGLGEIIMRRSSRQLPSYMEYRQYKTGEYLAQINEFSRPPARLLHRAHLLDALKERVPSSKINLSKRLVSIEYEAGALSAPYTLHFEDGGVANADIVIGCDGIKSNVRQYMGFVDSPKYSGQVVYRGFVDYKDLPDETAQLLRRTVNFRGPKKHVLVLPIGNRETQKDRAAIIGFMTESLDLWESESWMSRSEISSFQEHVQDWCLQVQHIVAVRDPSKKWFHVKHGQRSSGVILLGDSAHSTLPHQGQGTCMAIESGIALAMILRHWAGEDIEAAFQFYQDLRKPRTDRVTQTSQEAGKLASSDSSNGMTEGFSPEVLIDRMRWIMEYDILEELRLKGAGALECSRFDKRRESLSSVL
ncbi:Uncharacterized protein PECH_000500 [Penicillium ucsense]|uniref:FAD-binding domain-containing protein n=1 Tax=Penicillium ucsense TaxID=2839758 RepID=A0A8J8WFF7_9EURO|nr:Uncharacterized protein PECM_001548 [Penicillium ucsense]KAF7732404.1 Uncharacterized protein PECH_000500 [Penicillium ucsense]